MFEMKKFLSVGVACLALMMGFSSCNKDKSGEINTPETAKGDTYVGLSLQFPVSGNGLKATDPKEHYNPKGEWKGRDDIQKITVYLVNATAGTVDKTSFDKSKFNGIDKNGMLTPKLAVEATPGNQVSAYVIINDTNSKIESALSSITSASEFPDAFNKVVQLTAVTDVASYSSSGKDLVVMTNWVAPTIDNKGAIAVADGVTAEQAKNGTGNQIKVNVVRVAARAMVTMSGEAMSKPIEIKRTNLTTGHSETTAKVKITKVEYAATGSALQLNPIQPVSLEAPKGIHNFLPSANYWKDFKGTGGEDVDGGSVDTSHTLFSYADPFATVTKLTEAVDASSIANALEAEQTSKFLLPITHKKGDYKKGNTAFFTIRVTFEAYNEDAQTQKVVGTDGHVYLGKTDGKFYTTLQKAQMKDESYDGVVTNAQQEVIKYTEGVMFYNIWINPDVPYTDTSKKISESPVFRNQVYHAHITGFKEIGLNWTPNKDPNKPDDPHDPDDPDDPFKPDDPLETDKTYLSVSLQVLPWTMHSYEVDLSNRY